jgi:hypothetical protein
VSVKFSCWWAADSCCQSRLAASKRCPIITAVL